MANLSKCGIDCNKCPWGPTPRKSMTLWEFEQFQIHSKKVLGFMPIKSPCVTCQIPDVEIPKNSKLPNRKCLIRQCVDKAGITNCAHCMRFPCDTLNATAGLWNRKSIEARLGRQISDEEYHTFVEPFEGIIRLMAVRALLKPDEITEPSKEIETENTVTDFPESLSVSSDEAASLKAVHDLLVILNSSSMGLQGADTFAQRHKLEILRAHVLRFLWIFGFNGRLEKEGTSSIVVEAETFLTNRGSEKTLAIWSFVDGTIFKILAEVGCHCERVMSKDLKSEDLVTGTGYLRNKGWKITLSLEQKAGGEGALKALQTYAHLLDMKYGKRAFQHFQVADMRSFDQK